MVFEIMSKVEPFDSKKVRKIYNQKRIKIIVDRNALPAVAHFQSKTSMGIMWRFE